MRVLIYTALAFMLLGAIAFAKPVVLPGHVQETVDTIIQSNLKPVVLTGPAIKEFNTEIVLVYGDQAALPDIVAYLVFVDTRAGVGTPLAADKNAQTVMAFSAAGDYVGAGKFDIALIKASLDQFDKEREALQPKT